MMSTNNILSPANGKPIIVPTQDIVLGLYYLSLMLEDEPGAGMVFANLDEALQALEAGVVSLHSKIFCRISELGPDGNEVMRRAETTPGRLLLFDILPKHPAVAFERLLNQLLTKREITEVVDEVYRFCGQKETVVFADRLMTLGFGYAARAGISFGKDDMLVPETKAKLVGDNQSLSKGLRERELVRLSQIRDALARVEAGTYGSCTACAGPVPFERLFVFPEAPECAGCGG